MHHPRRQNVPRASPKYIALDTMIWAAALTGTSEADDASNYLMRIEQAGERVATEEEKECILRRSDN